MIDNYIISIIGIIMTNKIASNFAQYRAEKIYKKIHMKALPDIIQENTIVLNTFFPDYLLLFISFYAFFYFLKL